MCRRNQLLGCAVIAFGLGLLVGHCLESALVCNTAGVVIIVFGFGVLKRK